VRPSIRALATSRCQSHVKTSCVWKNVPLLRSKNESRYNIDTAGRSLKSSLLSNFFSLMEPGRISTSESDVSDAAGALCFSEAMVLPKFARRDGNVPQLPRGKTSTYHLATRKAAIASMMQERGFNSSTHRGVMVKGVKRAIVIIAQSDWCTRGFVPGGRSYAC
jgi:hypothetical protein